MSPGNHWRFSNSYTYELLNVGTVISGKQLEGKRHILLSFIYSSFLTLFNSRIAAFSDFGLGKKLIQGLIQVFPRKIRLLHSIYETGFFQKWEEIELNNHFNFNIDIC